MEISLRPATIDDASALADLAALTFPLACPSYHSAENIAVHLANVLSVANFVDYVESAEFSVFVAETSGGFMGFAMADYREPTDAEVQQQLANKGRAAELSKLYVHPECHGAGLAHDLLAHILDDMRQHDVEVAWLTVNQLNARANAFYEKCGFAVAANKTYRVGDVLDDDYLRIRNLDDDDDAGGRQPRILEG